MKRIYIIREWIRRELSVAGADPNYSRLLHELLDLIDRNTINHV